MWYTKLWEQRFPNFRKFGETMRFLYEETAAGIRILRSFGGDPSVVLPEMVEGKPVTELGPYAFSDHIDQKDLEKAIETGRFCREDGETADGTDENLSVSGEKVSEASS